MPIRRTIPALVAILLVATPIAYASPGPSLEDAPDDPAPGDDAPPAPDVPEDPSNPDEQRVFARHDGPGPVSFANVTVAVDPGPNGTNVSSTVVVDLVARSGNDTVDQELNSAVPVDEENRTASTESHGQVAAEY